MGFCAGTPPSRALLFLAHLVEAPALCSATSLRPISTMRLPAVCLRLPVGGEFLLDGPRTYVILYTDFRHLATSGDFETLHADLRTGAACPS